MGERAGYQADWTSIRSVGIGNIASSSTVRLRNGWIGAIFRSQGRFFATFMCSSILAGKFETASGVGVMPERDIVVMGASAGGVDALKETVRGLRPDIRASFFVVLHFPPFEKSHLPAILSRVGPLPAVHPKSGDLIQP